MAGFPTTRPIMGAPLTITNDVEGSYTFQPQAGMMAGNLAESLEKYLNLDWLRVLQIDLKYLTLPTVH